MKIASVIPSKHVKDRFTVTFEDDTVVKVTLNQVADYSLFAGRDLSDEEYADMTRDASESNIRARALRILGARNMSKKQIIRKLVEKGEDEALAGETAEWLEKTGAINDAEYARLIVLSYSEKNYGAVKIKDELYRRGIPSELWDEAFGSLPDTSDGAFEFIEKKLGTGAAGKDEIRKAANAAMRRGFTWDEISAAVSRYKTEYEVSD